MEAYFGVCGGMTHFTGEMCFQTGKIKMHDFVFLQKANATFSMVLCSVPCEVRSPVLDHDPFLPCKPV